MNVNDKLDILATKLAGLLCKGLDNSNASAEDQAAAEVESRTKAIVIETIGFVREDAAGDRFIDWTLEGGICALEVGCELTATAVQVTNDEGYGEIYTTPPAAASEARDERIERFLRTVAQYVGRDIPPSNAAYLAAEAASLVAALTQEQPNG